MKQLYSVFTYYQLITAIQIKTKCFPESDADIVISDHSNGYDRIIENLSKENIFNNVYTNRCVEALKLNTKKKKVQRMAELVFNNNNFPKKCCTIKKYEYDEFLFFNYNYFDSTLYNLLKKNNNELICRRFEEGYSSYFSPEMFVTGSVRLQRKFRKLHHNPIHENDITNMYFYVPELVLFHDYESSPIPHIDSSDTEFKHMLNRIFGYTEASQPIAQKYIFFEESFNVDGRQMEDLELVKKIAETVGPENIYVKLHPRSRVDRFAEYGIETSKKSGVPWELMLLNEDYSDKVFLTISSGSVLSPRIVFDMCNPTYMLFNCTQTKSFIVDDNFERYMEGFKKVYGDRQFYIPQNTEELVRMLKG